MITTAEDKNGFFEKTHCWKYWVLVLGKDGIEVHSVIHAGLQLGVYSRLALNL